MGENEINEEQRIQHMGPRPYQASRGYLLLLLLLTAGSAFLVKPLGLGGNLWVNELGYMLLIPVWLAWRGRWSWRESFRLQKPPHGVMLPAVVIGGSLWFANAVVLVWLEKLVGRAVGPMPGAGMIDLNPLQVVLFLVGIVVLAPFCEEIFFRGFMQRAYEAYGPTASWVVTGLLFGVMHILNGMTAALPATLLGLVIGYIAYATGSIWPAIALHAMNNLMSRIGLILLPEIAQSQLSARAYVMGVGGLIVGLLALQLIRKNSLSASAIWSGEEAKPLWRSLSVWLAVAFLTFAVGAEMAVRTGILNTPGEQPGLHSKMHFGRTSGVSKLFTETVAQSEVGGKLVFRYEIDAEAIDATLAVVNPQGDTVWEKQWVGSQGITVGSTEQTIDLSAPGTWSLELRGTAEELDINVYWRKAP